MANGDILRRIKDFAEAFAEEQLRGYISRISKPGAISNVPKEINDSLWGTIKVSPLEVVILDSPLVQRLRQVRQLGVVHWVYPGASHSRFEHTIGVLHQSQQLVTAINQASGQGTDSAPINAFRGQLVRLCAILHDIGHGAFSHVSEHALIRRTDLRLALAEFAASYGLPKAHLSEVIAHYLIGSPAFLEMLTLALDATGTALRRGGRSNENARQIAELAQRSIIGLHIDEEVPLLHEIITGPFDADKLDYYVRDARQAGVPSVLDISRLLQKIVVKRVPLRDVPTHIKEALGSTIEACDLFGLKWSGAPILDELHLARVLLYAKVYRQKKVLALEAMVDALFDALGAAEGADPVKLVELCFRFSDDQFIVSSAAELLSAAGLDGANEGLSNYLSDIIVRLRERDLYVTSFALLAKYPDDPWQQDKPQSRGLNTLAADCENAQKAEILRIEIANELKSLVAAVPDAIEDVPAGTLDYSIVISAKPKLAGGTEIDHALVLQGEKFIRGRDMERINQPAWADAYNFGSPLAHVFAPRETSLATYVAVERLIRRKYEAVLPRSAIELSKQEYKQVADLKHRLEKAGWYTGVPMDIRPMPPRLERGDVTDRVESLAIKFDTIDEPKGTLAPRRAPQMRDRILSWLSQFRDDGSIASALKCLEALRVLGREDSYDCLSAFAEKHTEFHGATVCPLGDLKDSGSVQTYLSRDLDRYFPRAATIEQAAERGDQSPVLFIDDFIGSGSQVCDILGAWFDENELKQDQLGETRLPFSGRERDFLLSRKVAFVFLAGWDEGLARLEEAAKRLGLEATVYCHIRETDIPFAFDGKVLDDADAEKFKSRCDEIGRALLASKGKSEAKQQERALGYGNRGMLLASRFNVPTQTLTCIWMDGQFDGVDWHALIRRRPKS